MPQPDTGIEGTISISPTHGGPIRVGEESSKPLVNMSFVVTSDTGRSTEFTTDDQGRFKILVSPGHYSVVRKGEQQGIGHYGPFDVDVNAGQMSRVAWQCDSGMR